MELTERQARYADAGLAVLARDGMGGISFRTVAAEAGMSLGAVQKAFATKPDLLRAMFVRLRTTTAQATAAEPGRPTLATWLTDLTLAALPLDAARRTAQLQGNAFGELALREPGFAEALREEDDALLASIERLVARAVGEGEVHPDVAPPTVARLWHAMATGLAQRLLCVPEPEDAVRPLVERGVRALLPPVER